MDKAPRLNIFSLTFLLGFGLGGFMGVLLGLLALALVQGEEATQPLAELVEPSATAVDIGITPTPEPKPKAKSTLDVRLGPGTAFAVVGTLARGGEVEPVGRDNSAAWVAIRFPPGSSARGWVPVSEVEHLNDVDRLAVVLPTPLPSSARAPDTSVGSFEPGARVVTPINTLAPGFGPAATQTMAAALGTPTPRPNVGPSDLVVNRAGLLPDGRVQVVVGNRGPGDLVGRSIFVAVRDLALRGEQLSSPVSTLPVGGVVALQSQNFRVERETDLQIIVDPFGNVTDPDRSNNQLTVTLSPQPGPAPTRSPFE